MKSSSCQIIYKSFFDNMTDGLACCRMIFDAQEQPIDFIYLKVNKSFEKVSKLKRVTGKRITKLIPGIKESNPELFEIYGRVSLGGKQETFETYIKSLGEWFSISTYSTQKKFFVVIMQNITKQKKTEKNLEDTNRALLNVFQDIQEDKKAIAHAEARYKFLLESIGDGMVATDQNGKIILINRAGEQMLGRTNRQVVGKMLDGAWPVLDEKGDQLPEIKRPVINALRSGTTIKSSSYFYVRKDGTKIPVAITITPVIVKNKTIGAIDIFRDITKEKEMEKLRTDFLSLASHQLRTPLSGTKWLIETMQRGAIGKINQQQKEYLWQIYGLNERMIKLVFDMLNVLRLESEVVIVEKKTVFVSNLYDEIIKSADPAAKEQKITLQNIMKNKVIVETDAQMLSTILDCFVSNAINYSPVGEKILLDAKEEPNAVVLSVEDKGIGIPKVEQSRIFEKFYRASNAKDLKPTGTGLGLHIAKMLADKIGAKVSFESKENKGSTFFVSIPQKSNGSMEKNNKIKNITN